MVAAPKAFGAVLKHAAPAFNFFPGESWKLLGIDLILNSP